MMETSTASLNVTGNVTGNVTNVTGGGGEAEPCQVSSIPGVTSSETLRGLAAFSSSYYSMHGYVSIAVCLFGLMSNSANIIVLTRKNMISSTNTILMWLAVADLLTMMSYLPFAVHFYIMREPGLGMFHTRSFGWIIFLLFHASFSIVCHTVAIWLTIALAIFRYIYICMPTKGSVYCSLRRAKITIFVVYALTVVICVPNYISNRYEAREMAGADVQQLQRNDSGVLITTNVTDNVTVYNPAQWENSLAAEITFKVNNWIQAILVKLVPCFMLTILTVLLIHAMHKAYRKRMLLKSQGRKAESEKHGEHNRTTGMLLAVVVLFTITELPQGILTLMNIFIDCFRPLVYNKLGDLLDAMALINNSVNFVLYCSMSKQFRDTFTAVFCSCCPAQRPGWLKLKLITSSNDATTTTVTTTLANSANSNNHTQV